MLQVSSLTEGRSISSIALGSDCAAGKIFRVETSSALSKQIAIARPRWAFLAARATRSTLALGRCRTCWARGSSSRAARSRRAFGAQAAAILVVWLQAETLARSRRAPRFGQLLFVRQFVFLGTIVGFQLSQTPEERQLGSKEAGIQVSSSCFCSRVYFSRLLVPVILILHHFIDMKWMVWCWSLVIICYDCTDCSWIEGRRGRKTESPHSPTPAEFQIFGRRTRQFESDRRGRRRVVRFVRLRARWTQATQEAAQEVEVEIESPRREGEA